MPGGAFTRITEARAAEAVLDYCLAATTVRTLAAKATVLGLQAVFAVRLHTWAANRGKPS